MPHAGGVIFALVIEPEKHRIEEVDRDKDEEHPENRLPRAQEPAFKEILAVQVGKSLY